MRIPCALPIIGGLLITATQVTAQTRGVNLGGWLVTEQW